MYRVGDLSGDVQDEKKKFALAKMDTVGGEGGCGETPRTRLNPRYVSKEHRNNHQRQRGEFMQSGQTENYMKIIRYYVILCENFAIFFFTFFAIFIYYDIFFGLRD